MAIQLDDFKALLADYPDGLPTGFKAVLIVGAPEGGSNPTDPGTDPLKPQHDVSFNAGAGGNNKMVPTFDIPDVNGNKAPVWEKTVGLIETACTLGQKGLGDKGWATLTKIYTNWAWLPRDQQVKNAGGNPILWPDKLTTGPYPPQFNGQWVTRAALTYTLSDAQIQELVNWTLAH